MAIVDRLETLMVLNARGYQDGASKVLSMTTRMGHGLVSLAKQALSLPSAIAGGVLAVAGGAASKAATDIESLKLGLVAVAGSTEEAERQFKRLKDVAKLPGLGLEEAVRGSIALQSTGLSAELAERAIRGFGNALATVGKGKEDLDGVITALGQIQSKGKLSAEEINQLAERVPQIRKLMQAAFGTSDTELLGKRGISSESFIASVTDQLEKLPKVAGGSKNVLENLGDSWQALLAGIGAGINKWLMPALQKVGDAVGNLANSGIIERVSAGFQGLFGGDLGDTLVKGLSWVVAILQNMPAIIKGMSDAFGRAMRFMEQHAAVFAGVLGGIFIGGSIVRGVGVLIDAFIKLRRAISAAGIASVIMEAIATGGKSLLKAGLALAAGAIAGVAIYKKIESMFDKPFGIDLAGLPGIGDIAKDQKDIYNTIKGEDPAPIDQPAGGKNDYLAQIARSNERIAVAEEKQLDLQTLLSGGSTLAKNVTSEYGRHRTLGGGGTTPLRRLFTQMADLIEASDGAQSPLNQRARMAQ
jgi:tape measure domain-containing protein